ncbi:MAG: hypothetical protein HZA53_00040 [Planctomycetes bacterium]|nr:hypothetical protein [Planctomycetota bacterium]
MYWFGNRGASPVDEHAAIAEVQSPQSAPAEPSHEQFVELDAEPEATRETAPMEAAPLEQEPDANPRDGDRTQAWERETDGLRPAELRELAAKEEKSLTTLASRALKERYEAGLYEVIGYGTRHKITKEEKADMKEVFSCLALPPKSDPPLPQHRTVLPANEYPELYQKKARIAWLREQAVLMTSKK